MNGLKTLNNEQLMLSLVVQKNGQSKLLTRKPIRYADLLPARDETWWQAVRLGVLPEDLDKIHMDVLPGENLKADGLDGCSILLNDGKRTYTRHYPNTFFARQAIEIKRGLLQEGTIGEKDSCLYFLSAMPAEEESDEQDSRIRVRSRPNPVLIGKASLARYLEASEPMPGEAGDKENRLDEIQDPMPVFVTGEAWEEGRELSRRGGKNESAGILTGRLMRDTDSPEVFMLLEACIAAEDAAEKGYSVAFSHETWSRARRLLEERRRRLNRPEEIIIGSVHGHNFALGGQPDIRSECKTCEQKHLCKQSTAFASTTDMEWHRIHFTGQPWAVLLVWGWNVRGEEEWRLYGTSGAALAPRNLRRLKSEM